MLPNDFHKKLIEESQKHATITDEMRYGVHFEYGDLVKRLTKVKLEKVKTDSVAQYKLEKATTVELIRTSQAMRNVKLRKDSPLRDLSASRLKIGLSKSKSPIRLKLSSTLKPIHKVEKSEISPLRVRSTNRLRNLKLKRL